MGVKFPKGTPTVWEMLWHSCFLHPNYNCLQAITHINVIMTIKKMVIIIIDGVCTRIMRSLRNKDGNSNENIINQ